MAHCNTWERAYPANVSGDVVRLFYQGRWHVYDLETLLDQPGVKLTPVVQGKP